jgi:hypothetical protein
MPRQHPQAQRLLQDGAANRNGAHDGAIGIGKSANERSLRGVLDDTVADVRTRFEEVEALLMNPRGHHDGIHDGSFLA